VLIDIRTCHAAFDAPRGCMSESYRKLDETGGSCHIFLCIYTLERPVGQKLQAENDGRNACADC